MAAETTTNYPRAMDLLKSTQTSDPNQDDYCQPVDAIKGLSLRTAEIRRSYRLSDRKMLRVQQAAANQRSSSADRVRSSTNEPEASPPPPPLPTRGPPPSHPPPDYEEPWDFRAHLRQSSEPKTTARTEPKAEQLPSPPAQKLPVEQEYEDPWDSPFRRGFSKPLEPLPPLPQHIPPASALKHKNGERSRRATVNSAFPSQRQVEIDTGKPLEEQPWYHGLLPRHDAEAILDTKPDFSFLVRKSETSRSYSLSLKCTSQLDQVPYIHIKIAYDPVEEGYVVGEFSKPFQSVPEAVRYYTLHKLRIRGAEHRKLLLPIGN